MTEQTTAEFEAAQDAAADHEADAFAFGAVDRNAGDPKWGEGRGWGELLFDAEGKPAGFTRDHTSANLICGKRPGWSHKPAEWKVPERAEWKTPVL